MGWKFNGNTHGSGKSLITGGANVMHVISSLREFAQRAEQSTEHLSYPYRITPVSLISTIAITSVPCSLYWLLSSIPVSLLYTCCQTNCTSRDAVIRSGRENAVGALDHVGADPLRFTWLIIPIYASHEFLTRLPRKNCLQPIRCLQGD